MFNGSTFFSNIAHLGGNDVLVLMSAMCDVKVEAMSTDAGAVVIKELITDDNHPAHNCIGIHNAVPATKCPARVRDGVNIGGYLVAVLRMLVGKHELSGWVHRSWLISVQPLKLFRPLPSLFVEIVPKPTNSLRCDHRDLVPQGNRIKVSCFGLIIVPTINAGRCRHYNGDWPASDECRYAALCRRSSVALTVGEGVASALEALPGH